MPGRRRRGRRPPAAPQPAPRRQGHPGCVTRHRWLVGNIVRRPGRRHAGHRASRDRGRFAGARHRRADAGQRHDRPGPGRAGGSRRADRRWGRHRVRRAHSDPVGVGLASAGAWRQVLTRRSRRGAAASLPATSPAYLRLGRRATRRRGATDGWPIGSRTNVMRPGSPSSSATSHACRRWSPAAARPRVCSTR